MQGYYVIGIQWIVQMNILNCDNVYFSSQLLTADNLS